MWDAVVELAVTVEPPAEEGAPMTATAIATRGFIFGLIFFILQLFAIIALLKGYKSQTWKPIAAAFAWLPFLLPSPPHKPSLLSNGWNAPLLLFPLMSLFWGRTSWQQKGV